MKKWLYGIPLITMVACTPVDSYVDNYFLGKDNTPQPQALKPIQEKIKISNRWTVPVGKPQSASQYLKIKPEIVGHVIYTADNSGLIQAVDKNTGQLLWSKKIAGKIISGPTVAQGQVVVTTDASKIVVLKAIDGNEQWQVGVSGEVLSKPLIAKGKLIAKTIDGNLEAFNFSNGKPLWVANHGSPSLILKASSSPVLLNDKIVLVGYSDGKMDAVDIETGRMLWQRSIAYAAGASDVERLVDIDADPIVQGSTVFLSSFQGYIGALSLETGQFIWRKPASIYKNMVIKGDTLYTTDSDDVVWSINKYTGRVNWKQLGLKSRGLTEPVLAVDKLVLGDKTGFVHVLSTKTGNFLSRIQVGAAVNIAPTVKENNFYLATTDGKLSRFSLG